MPPVRRRREDRSRELSRLRGRVQALLALQQVALKVTAELDLDELLHTVVRSAVTVMNCTAGSLLLHDPRTGELVFEVVEGGGGEALEKTRFPCERGIAGAAFTTARPVVVRDAADDTRHYAEVSRRFEFDVHSLVAVPLIARSRTIGVLEVMNRASDSPFTRDDVDLLLAFASQSAIAIENARLFQSVIKERDRILYVEEGVRREVARELHDGPAQMLAALIMGIRNLNKTLAKAPERIEADLLQLEASSQKALYQVRNILFDLRPVILESQGLGPALQGYAERLRSLEPFNLELDVRHKTHLRPNVEGVVFSILQEAVNNAKKHGAPRNVWIKTAEARGWLILTVRDDGCGFEVQEVQQSLAARNSFGLLNMRERAEVAGGRLQIESAPGRGTKITLRVPLTAQNIDQAEPDI